MIYNKISFCTFKSQIKLQIFILQIKPLQKSNIRHKTMFYSLSQLLFIIFCQIVNNLKLNNKFLFRNSHRQVIGILYWKIVRCHLMNKVLQ